MALLGVPRTRRDQIGNEYSITCYRSHDADRGDRDSAARAGDAVHDFPKTVYLKASSSDCRCLLGCAELDESKSEMGRAKRVLEVYGSDRNDRDGAARAGDAVHDFPKKLGP